MGEFDDLLASNRAYAEANDLHGYDGLARAGVAVVTCMDSMIDPLKMIGLERGDAKIFRNPGGRVTDAALEALVLATHLLGVSRVLVVAHTRCTVASATEEQLRGRLADSVGHPVPWHPCTVVDDQKQALVLDVAKVRSHPLVPERVSVGGFIYDVDTGQLSEVVGGIRKTM